MTVTYFKCILTNNESPVDGSGHRAKAKLENDSQSKPNVIWVSWEESINSVLRIQLYFLYLPVTQVSIFESFLADRKPQVENERLFNAHMFKVLKHIHLESDVRISLSLLKTQKVSVLISSVEVIDAK